MIIIVAQFISGCQGKKPALADGVLGIALRGTKPWT